MKIIKLGDDYGMFPMVVKCKQVLDEYGFGYGEEKDFCGSELEVDRDDIRKHPWFKYPCFEGVDYGVICPACGNFIVIDKSKIPIGVMNLAPKVNLST